jgi:sarcosine oxidase subunit alpha
MKRLPAPYGALIDRDQPVSFSFENKAYLGFAGDSIASALAANNQWLLSRSFKYHRPRGILTMAGQDANTLVQLPSNPNALADREAITDNLAVMGQNYSGSLRYDRGSLLGLFSRFLPVGFYYKAFFKPRGIWEKWAPLIRKKSWPWRD